MQLALKSNTSGCNLNLFSLLPKGLSFLPSQYSQKQWCLPFCLLFFFPKITFSSFWLELHCVWLTVSQLTAHLDSSNVHQQYSLVPTYSSLNINKVALYCCLTPGWLKSSAVKQYRHSVLGNSMWPVYGVQKLTASRRQSQTSPRRGCHLLPLTHCLLREPGQTQLLWLLRLRVAARVTA